VRAKRIATNVANGSSIQNQKEIEEKQDKQDEILRDEALGDPEGPGPWMRTFPSGHSARFRLTRAIPQEDFKNEPR
jgi:hypothetical protein